MNDRKTLPTGVEIIQPADTLRRRAPPQAKRLSEITKDAEAAILSQREAYKGRLAKDIENLHRLHLQLLQSMSEETLEEVRFIAHDMKGQGTTFGYPLITRISDSLAKFLTGKPALDSRTLDIITVHVDSLLLVVGNGLAGDHPDGEVLVANLKRLLVAEKPENLHLKST